MAIRDFVRQPSLRYPPPRQPPQSDPAVESWLDSLPNSTSKASPELFRDWRLDDGRDSAKGWLVASIIFRSMSLILAFIVAVVALAVVVKSTHPTYQAVPAAVTPFIAVWNGCELIAVCIRHGRGIPARIHVWCDLAVVVFAAITTGMLITDAVIESNNARNGDQILVNEITEASLLIAIIVIHATLFCFFICNCTGHRETPAASRSDTLRDIPMHVNTTTEVLVGKQPNVYEPSNPRDSYVEPTQTASIAVLGTMVTEPDKNSVLIKMTELSPSFAARDMSPVSESDELRK